MQMNYKSVVVSVFFYAAVCWGGSLKKKKQKMRLDQCVKKVGWLCHQSKDGGIGEVEERYTMRMMESILNNTDHPLQNTFMGQRSSGGGRLLSLMQDGKIKKLFYT